jgi:hypothetical protein
MAWSGGRCSGEQVCGTDSHCPGCRDLLAHPEMHAAGAQAIPIRRYGTVPDLPDDSPGWEIQNVAHATPRTIGEYGAVTVLAAGVAAALVAGLLLYLR